MDKIHKSQVNIFQVLLILLVLLSLIPIFILIIQSMNNLDIVKSLSNKTVETTVKQQTVQMYKTYSQNLAQRISDFLYSCDLDLEDLSKLPAKPEIYLHFSQKHQRWINSQKSTLPVYKEISLVNKNGVELIKIVDNHIVPQNQLKDISIPKNTTFKSETYFQETKTGDSDIYVSHLTGWYVNRHEQLEQGKSYTGVIRFCKKLKDDRGNFNGICMLALDHRQLMDFMCDESDDKTSLIEKYKTGNYNYIIDDEGWIITHPKLWDIRGLDRDALPVESLTKDTPKWKVEAGLIPINLIKMDWRLRDIYTDEPISSVIKRVQRGETVIATMTSSGIFREFKGIIRTRAYAPILYNSGPYSKHGIFGIVVFGKSLEEFLNNARILTKEIDSINKHSKKRMIFIAVIISIAVIFFSLIVARSIAKPLQKLNKVLAQIGGGNFIVPEINSSIHEIRELSVGVKSLTNDLKGKDEKINQYVKDLKTVNKNLAEVKKELDSYWKREYETESDTVLEEKIKAYEQEYPKLKEIRNSIYIGNSPQILRVLRQIVPLSQMTIPTWIYGESGVGKTILARAIHLLSPRSEKPFQAFAASEFAAADPMIVLGKLFGYGPGHGLRGIDKNGQKGIVEECDGGTLLIDDVDALPLGTQAQLLRVVDGLSCHPAAGKSRNITLDTRFIFTTNVDLEQLVKEKLFRKDLFRRMGGSINKIEIPPLRSLRADIQQLTNYFIEKYCKRYGVALQIEKEALRLLTSHDFKEGNIGELKMLIDLACENARIEGERIITGQYFPAIAMKAKSLKDQPGFASHIFNDQECKKLSILRANNFRMEASEQALGYKRGSRILSHHLRGMCLKALCHTEWNIEQAARLITDSISPETDEIINQRIKGYIKNISDKGKTSQESALFSHLPKEYHSFLIEAIQRIPNILSV